MLRGPCGVEDHAHIANSVIRSTAHHPIQPQQRLLYSLLARVAAHAANPELDLFHFRFLLPEARHRSKPLHLSRRACSAFPDARAGRSAGPNTPTPSAAKSGTNSFSIIRSPLCRRHHRRRQGASEQSPCHRSRFGNKLLYIRTLRVRGAELGGLRDVRSNALIEHSVRTRSPAGSWGCCTSPFWRRGCCGRGRAVGRPLPCSIQPRRGLGG